MKKYLYILLISPIFSLAQVGINTTTPNAQLEIKSSNQATPANTDGILIPKIDAFPAVNLTAAQKGMLVYLTTASGANQPGFYYWNNPGWIGIVSGTGGGTLDQSYDFGGAGAGRTITADTGAVTVAGTDGFVSTGTELTGAIPPSGAGTRMVWNPRKAAFRAGTVIGTKWDDASIGVYSTAFGYDTTASGPDSTASGSNSTASGGGSTALGSYVTASGLVSTAFGANAVASGSFSTAFGFYPSAIGYASTAYGNRTFALGKSSTAFGQDNTAFSYGEVVLGLGATSYTPSTNGATEFSDTNATDRLLVVGNAIDSNNSGGVDTTEKSDAFIILKNGLTRLPSTTNTMIAAADGKAVVTKEFLQANTSGTLDQAYDFGGAGAGRTITADTGAVTIAGTDGFVSTGTSGSGAVAPSGAGTRMVWNPRKGAFRAGQVSANQWDDVNLGSSSVAFGAGTTASGLRASAFGSSTIASGQFSTAFGSGTSASGDYSTAFGSGTSASGYYSSAFGSNTIASAIYTTTFGESTRASSSYATAFGQSTLASGGGATSFGVLTTASGNNSSAFGFATTASGTTSSSFGDNTVAAGANSFAAGANTNANGLASSVLGKSNIASSFSETVIGVGATNYFPSTNGATEFRAANATDRLFVVGNAIDANNNSIVDSGERSDALVILKNGLTRLPSTTNTMIAAADGKAVVTKEFLQANTSGTLDQAYDFSGAGAGRTITADTGAVTIDGTDGLVSTGIEASGAFAPVVTGPIMYWNPRKSSFRAGLAFANSWEDLNVGLRSTAFGENTLARGNNSIAWGIGNIADGSASTAFGLNTNATGTKATAFGESSTASGTNSTAFGVNSIASGDFATAFGSGCIANNFETTAFGASTTASGLQATAFGVSTTASGTRATAFGTSNTAFSFSETVIGIGATTYTTSGNGAIQFRSTNATDRLFVIGNAIDTNNNGLVDAAERSNAIVVLKNGNTGIGSSTPQDKLHVVGNIRMVDGNQAAGKVLTSDANGTASWQNASSWGLTGNGGTNSATNFIGTTDAVDFVAKTSNVERVRIKSSGEVGIGTSSPADRLHVVGNIRMVDGNQAVGKVLTSDANGTATWQNASANAWGLSGNTGTNTATNFIGTTDDVDIILRRFNIRAGRIGTNNTSLGVNALNTTATGTSNTAIGVDALKSATTGTNNTAIGQNALGIINSGTYNTAIGSEASTSSTLLTNATAIGSRSLAGANNVMVLGSINGVNGATSSVNVGIGTTTPSARLEIVDENAVTAAITRGNLHVMTNNPQALDIGGAITLGGYSDDAASATRVFASVEGRKSTATSGTSSGYLQFKTNNSGTLTERVRITNIGNVGVGTATPGGQFELSLDQGRKPGTTTWTVTSDERLKDISGDYTFGLEAIKQLRPIRYHYKNVGDRSFDPKILATEFSGFSAQEVQKVFPNCVTTDEDGYLSLNIHDIVIASINAIKELDKKNAELQLENEALKRKLQQHDEQLAAILAELQKRQ